MTDETNNNKQLSWHKKPTQTAISVDEDTLLENTEANVADTQNAIVGAIKRIETFTSATTTGSFFQGNANLEKKAAYEQTQTALKAADAKVTGIKNKLSNALVASGGIKVSA